ncbi:MAG: hypothetical protein JSV88_05580 [Candidatus Aminicenantes bacterium]|nr:MAG: hypothetical protein JSV88_05580 [Candidatus Aminicenantes bacterium]
MRKKFSVTKRLFLSPVACGILLSLVVTLPLLKYSQFREDDHIQLGVLSGKLNYPWMGSLNLYGFISGDPGYIPGMISQGPFTWEMGINSSLKVNFFRPLSSALMSLTYKVFGLKPLGYTLHSISWYTAAVILLGFLFMRIFPRSENHCWHPAVYIALIMFAISSSNSFTVMWNAARWIIIAVTLSLAGLLAHIKWREDNWRWGRLLSLAAFLTALLAGEVTLAVMAFVAAYELLAHPDPLKKRIKALLPATLLVVVYLALYKGMGCGTAGISDYLDPFNDTAAFFSALPGKGLSFMGELFFGSNASLWYFPERRLAVVLLGAAAIVLVGLLLYPVWKSSSRSQQRRILWIITGTLGSLLPLSARSPSSHVMLIPLIGGSVLVGFILYYWGQQVKKLFSFRNVPGILACTALVVLLFIRPPLAWYRFAGDWQENHQRVETFHCQSVLNQLLPHQKAIFLNFNDWAYDFHGYYYRKLYDMPMPASWWRLSSSSQPRRYLRTAEDTLEMEVIDDSQTRGSEPMNNDPGKDNVIRLQGLQVTILKTGLDGPNRVEFKFDRSLDDGVYRFLLWREGCLHFQEPPPVGESIVVSNE